METTIETCDCGTLPMDKCPCGKPVCDACSCACGECQKPVCGECETYCNHEQYCPFIGQSPLHKSCAEKHNKFVEDTRP